MGNFLLWKKWALEFLQSRKQQTVRISVSMSVENIVLVDAKSENGIVRTGAQVTDQTDGHELKLQN